MKNKLKKTLTNLWSGELAAVFVFWLDYFLFKWLDHTMFKDRIFGTGIFSSIFFTLFLLLFALVEWINYFEWRLSYSYNPAVVIRYTLQRKLKRSKIAKEIEQSGKVCML